MKLPALRRGRTLLLVSTTAAAALFAGAMLAQAQQPGATAAPAASPAAAAPNAAKKPGAKSGAATEEPSQKSSTRYSLGVFLGEQLRGSGVAADAVSPQRIAQGVHDALTGKTKAGEADRQNMVNLLRQAQETLAETNHRAAAKQLRFVRGHHLSRDSRQWLFRLDLFEQLLKRPVHHLAPLFPDRDELT